MDYQDPICIEFLDLTGVDEYEKDWVLTSLHSHNANIQFPWETFNFIQDSEIPLAQSNSNANFTSPNVILTTNINMNDSPNPPYPQKYQMTTAYSTYSNQIQPTSQPCAVYINPSNSQQQQPANVSLDASYSQQVQESPNNVLATLFVNSNINYAVENDHAKTYINTKLEITQGFKNSAAPLSSNNHTNSLNAEDCTSVPVEDIESNNASSAAVSNVETAQIPPIQSPNNPSPATKSWASLFSKSNGATNLEYLPKHENVKCNKPLALVSPFSAKTTGEQEVLADVSTLKEPFKSNVDDPNLHRMGEYLSTHSVDNRIISLQPRGLINRSNYCYINSILQALLACPPVYNLLSGLAQNSSPSTEKKRITPVIDSMTKLVKEFHHLPAGLRVGRRSEKNPKKEQTSILNCDTPLEPTWMHKMLSGMRCDTFVVEGRQEDAEEFLGCLLNGMNDEMLELIKMVESLPTSGINDSDGSQSQDEDKEWQVMGPKNKGSITRRTELSKTPISEIFGGLLRSHVHRTGDQSTDNIQPFFTLQLNIERAATVREALEALVSKNQLEGVTSSKTNQEVEAWQQVTIEELPLVLVLHLKCFDYKLDGCSKIIKALEFPVDLKIDAKLLSSKMNYLSKEKQYKLFAVVYHDGKEATKGHYLTDVYHVGYASWLRFDDASVKTVQEEQVLNPSGTRVPYLLFYRRSDSIRVK